MKVPRVIVEVTRMVRLRKHDIRKEIGVEKHTDIYREG